MDQPNPITPNPAPANPVQPKVQPQASKIFGLISPTGMYQGSAQQNLMDPTAVVNTPLQSAGWKPIVLDVFAVILAGAFGYSFARYLAGGFSLWFVFGGLLLWGAASVLKGFLEKNISHGILVIFLETIALIAFFYTYAWQALFITGILVMVCLIWGYFSVRRELRNTLELRFFAASGKVIGKLITAAVIFMIIMYASLTNSNGNFFVSQNGFNIFFNWGAELVNNFYPTLPLNGSFGDFSQAVAQMQLQGNPAFQSLTPAEQSSTLAESTNQVAGIFSSTSSTSASASTLSESTSNAFYNYFVAIMQKLQDRFGDAFVGVWGLILFLTLRSIGIIVVWVGQFVSLIFYELLLATGFIKMSEEQTTKEIIEY